MYSKKTHIHFVGIGGIGMSGIATILHQQGYIISGCDIDIEQSNIKKLASLGCAIYHGNNNPACFSDEISIIVYSSAVHRSAPEILAAQERGIPTIPRALMLAELMRTKFSIAVAGAHGKTTTTSLIAHILIELGMDPTVIIGGHLKNIATNARQGTGDFLIAEADESDRSLLFLQATVALITNIDLEHLETYTDLADIINTFKRFLDNLPFYGAAILCLDDPNIKKLFPINHRTIVTYGFDSSADIVADEYTLFPDYSTFTVHDRRHTKQKVSAILKMPGLHNIQNCVGALAVTTQLGIPLSDAAATLESFTGVERRFSFRGVSKTGAEIFDDYGHHPTEIVKTITVARNRTHKKLIVIFQPHRYTRTQALWNDFIETFATNAIDHLVITDIYAASEKPIDFVTAENLTQAISKKFSGTSVSYISTKSGNYKELCAFLESVTQADDLILIQGAGNLYKIASLLINQQ